MRLVWQGFTHPSATGAYNDALVAHLNAAAREGTTVEFRGVVPPDRHIHRLTEWRCSVQALRSAIEAEREGADAVVLGHFQEAGLWELRATLDVPVLGLGEASMLWACQLGFRFGLVTIHPLFIPWHEQQARQYALDARLAGARSMRTSVDQYVAAFGGDEAAADDMERQFLEEARPLVAAGAEVLIPAGGFPALLLARRGVTEVDGALVLDANAVVVKMAEAAVDLRAFNGTVASRRSTFALPSPEARDEFLQVTGSLPV
jgi:Asp/Glu/hydantoin racemase